MPIPTCLEPMMRVSRFFAARVVLAFGMDFLRWLHSTPTITDFPPVPSR